ncbi:hypothetical protein EET67_16215 [Pseudaminobacter arsenicus]|uniref:Uncharacterized protein n=1 Tax=Borborobacter arsenicus TaxID=1851146 RepID=A0A432V3R4_9HYPH|nr:hypothetical protein [Pseudaminobacter arsenicus]RUM96775.1 hypothetical protein EET67_16215 [Pseudaminobacter arsenicus]
MRGMRILTTTAALIVAAEGAAGDDKVGPPVGVYLWHPIASRAPTDDDCRALVAEVKPSSAKTEDWLWGRVPEGAPRAVEFYLFLSETRMETTFAAEGDYDYGSVVWDRTTAGGASPFELTPDDNPDVTIKGPLSVPSDREVFAVTLENVPLDGKTVARTTYFCRFEDQGTET